MLPQEYYQQRIVALHAELKELKNKRTAFGVLRFGAIVAIALVVYFLWQLGGLYVAVFIALFLGIFLFLVKKHLANNELIDHKKLLVKINEEEIDFLKSNHSINDGGERFKPHTHPYAEDLDILGNYSLYRYINRTVSEPGEAILANWLLHPSDKEVILKRQEAVKELSGKISFVQEIMAAGRKEKIGDKAIENAKNWLNEPNKFLPFKPWQWLRYLLPLIAIVVTYLYFDDRVNEMLFYFTLFLMLLVAFQINKVVAPVHRQLSEIIAQIGTVEKIIVTIENEHFQSVLLNRLHHSIKMDGQLSSKNISQLKNFLERLDLRYNIVAAPILNIFLQWNLQQMLELEKWKNKYGSNFENWFHIIAQFEALGSLAVLHHNFPQWAFPEFTNEYFSIEATDLGHPFIPEPKRVENPLQISNRNEIMLITGSNMAGKSTYLRSVGVNVVLAMCGAPVCAKKMRLYPVQIMSSMRISDNLEESTSTFYAELKKLKAIINEVNAGREIFILLDEILRGTNTYDRHTGAKALIEQLVRHKVPAIIATHDTDLTKLAENYSGKIINYHFDVQISGEELYFDYKLKPGICTSMNASLLMKKIGIEME